MKKYAQFFFEELAQVLFLKNAIFGLLFLFASICFSPKLFICGLFSALVGFIYSRIRITPKLLKDGGLVTINGFFFGVAMASLFHESPQFYTCLILGSLLVPSATIVVYEVLQHWKLSPFIIPYILVVWTFFLCASLFSFEFSTEHENLMHSFSFLNDFSSINQVTYILTSALTSMGRVFFLPNPSYGLVLLLLIAVFNFRLGFYFFSGITAATLATYFLSMQSYVGDGLSNYTFSAGLVALGLASFPERYRPRTIILFCLFSMILTVALVQFLSQLGLPVLSLPYVLTISIALLSRTPKLNISWAS